MATDSSTTTDAPPPPPPPPPPDTSSERPEAAFDGDSPTDTTDQNSSTDDTADAATNENDQGNTDGHNSTAEHANTQDSTKETPHTPQPETAFDGDGQNDTTNRNGSTGDTADAPTVENDQSRTDIDRDNNSVEDTTNTQDPTNKNPHTPQPETAFDGDSPTNTVDHDKNTQNDTASEGPAKIQNTDNLDGDSPTDTTNWNSSTDDTADAATIENDHNGDHSANSDNRTETEADGENSSVDQSKNTPDRTEETPPTSQAETPNAAADSATATSSDGLTQTIEIADPADADPTVHPEHEGITPEAQAQTANEIDESADDIDQAEVVDVAPAENPPPDMGEDPGVTASDDSVSIGSADDGAQSGGPGDGDFGRGGGDGGSIGDGPASPGKPATGIDGDETGDVQTPGDRQDANDTPIDPDAVSTKPDGSPWPESPLSKTDPLPKLDEADVQRGENGLVESVDGRPVRDYLHGLADERTDGYRDARRDGSIRKDEVAPVTSVLLDTRTGRAYEAINQGEVGPADLHPILQERVDGLTAAAAEKPDAYQYGDGAQGGFPHFSVPGTHAEVLNASRALYDREAMGYQVTPESLGEMLVDNRFPYRPDDKTAAPCCPNCTAILGGEGGGVESIPGKLPIDEWRRQ
ncbi:MULTISPECIES: YwqJ-related putative deaminase [unclassified Pseudofrankia]|uniref:YwqJ-related putative deaminase n=1 Tax=unclassified Pseudofrankia TaxID=2994372 RepID=UPI0008D9DDF8|nr:MULTISPECIES: YwqJ-related putative deaminase [unclassified Pseudofrankia]MDT3440044.1 YwqJ-related putative deaminase [Pseudofrankia sp. BMG5.37]OHV44671.1 hypothetical protein BCD48_24570 [Pseudofrankia sp. BMG5.36]